MPRNRIIYQSEALYCGPSPATGFLLNGVATSFSGDFVSGSVGSATGLGAGRINPLAVGGTGFAFGTGLSSANQDFRNVSFANVLKANNFTGLNAGVGFTGTFATSLVQQLHRIQDINYSFTVDRTNVNQFGELAAIDRIILAPPTVSLDFSYLLNSFSNEKLLGFSVDGTGSAIRNLLSKTSDERNYFIKTVAEGVDAQGEGDNVADVIGVGNGFLTSYGVEASVGSFPTISVSVEGLNMSFDTNTAISTRFTSPAIDPENGARSTTRYFLPMATGNAGTGDLDISVLRPGDITFSIKRRDASADGDVSEPTGSYITPGQNFDDSADRKIQSFSVSLGLDRTPIEKLGSRFAFSREINFPIDVTASIEAMVTDLTTGSLSDLINYDDAYNITMNINKPQENRNAADPEGNVPAVKYIIKNAKVNSQSFSSSIGANKMVTIEFGSQIGGPNQTRVGFFMSGNSSDMTQITNNDIKITDSTVR